MKKHVSNRASAGFTLMELMISMALGLVLLVTVVMMYSSARQSFRLQSGLTQVQEDGRVAMLMIADEIRQAGFRTTVWNNPRPGYAPLTQGSVNGAQGGSDTLQLMYMDHEDCNSVVNANFDPEILEPRADYKRITFSVDANGLLLINCEYGEDPQNLTAQISNQMVVDGVESFQVLYGIDTDFPPDMSINSWTTVNNINPTVSVCLQSRYLCEVGGLLGDVTTGIPTALKVGLLLASSESAGGDASADAYQILDVTLQTPDDQRLRKAFTSTVTLRNLTL